MIGADHLILFNDVLPVAGLIEITLVMHRVGTRSWYRPDLDNQIATYLNLDPVSGFARWPWQSHVGTVLVARKDEKPLLPQHMEAVWMFCDYILDFFGEGQGAPTHLYKREAFERWWEEYSEEMREIGRDDWLAVRSPYEM